MLNSAGAYRESSNFAKPGTLRPHGRLNTKDGTRSEVRQRARHAIGP